MYSPQITPFQPSNIDATTKMLMGLQQKGQLQQYVAQHKNDPNLVALALYVSNMSKAKPAVQAEANQPKIVDQAIAGMAPQQMLPEDQGIATLPAPNMQNMAGGGIVAFDEGGDVPGYKSGGMSDQEYSDAFNRAYKRLLKVEGGFVKNDAGMGPSMYGVNWTANKDTLKKLGYTEDTVKTLTPEHAKQIYKRDYWDAIGGDKLAKKDFNFANVAFDGAANQGVPTIKPMLTKAGNDPYKLLELRQQRYEDLATPKENDTPAQAARRKEHQKSIEGWRNRTAALKTEIDANQNNQRLPGGTPGAQAIAATPPVGAGTNPAINQIPGQTGQAPAAKDESTFFGGIADRLGISPEAQRNISNTLMAPTPLAPVTTLPKAAKSSGLAALGEKIYDKFAPAAGMTEKQIAALRAETEAAKAAEIAQAGQLPLRITPPAQVLEQGSQVIPVAQTGEATVQSAADLEKARLAAQATDQLAASQAAARTAAEASKLPSMAERLQQASYLRESDEAARLMARARAATNAKTTIQTGEGLAAIAPDLTADNTTANKYASGIMGGAPLPSAEDDIVAALKNKPEAAAAAPEEKTGGMDMNRLMLQMGLHLMAGKSPNALTNVGEAGLGALGMQQAEAKAKTEDEYRKAMGLEAGSKAKYYDAYTAATERGAKEKNLELEAEKLIAQEISKDKFLNMPGQEAARTKREQEMRATIYRNLGIKPTMTAGAPTGGAKFIGFENPA